MRRLFILAIFLLSGAAGLIYQVVWMRQLTLIVGVTSQAVSTVLAVFMGGLALGSWLMGRAGDETRSPLRFYGWLELGIALFGVQSLLLLQGILVVYADLKLWAGDWFPAVRFGIACLALLGPTTLMGATLPVLIKGVCRTSRKIARDSGLLYGINTLGAVGGTLVAAFYLVETFGIRNTTFVAAGINLLVGLLALWMARIEKAPEEHPAVAEPEQELSDAPPDLAAIRQQRRTARAVIIAFGVSGFLALAYEVLWTRYLIYVVRENSVFAFATMLAAFLLGIALGSFLAALVADRIKNRVALLGGVLVLLGGAAATTVTLMGVLYSAKSGRFGGGEFWDQSISQFLRSLGVLIVPTTLSGSTFAIVARIYARDVASLGADAGRAYAINTLGAILGAMAGGFLILPHLGLIAGLITLSVINVLLGLWLLLLNQPRGRSVKTAWATGILALAAFVSIPIWARTPVELLQLSEYDHEIIYYADGPESSIAVEKSRDGNLSILVDGEGQAGTDLRGQIHLRLLGHLPAIFHPAPREALVVAFGAGITTGCVLQHPIDHLDQVELNPRVIYGAAEYFAEYNHDPVNHPKFTAVIDDGRNYLLATDKMYDIITSDPIDPNDAGTTSLYCKEYYELVRDHLNDGGLACQWITVGYGKKDFDMLVRTFQSVFHRTAIWYADFTTVVVGYKDEPTMTLADLRAKFEIPEVRDSLAHVGIDSAEMLLAMMLVGPDEVEKMLFTADPEQRLLNTDDRPRIEYYRASGAGWDESREWKPMLELRNPDHSDWLAAWSDDDRQACSAAYGWMDALYRREIELRRKRGDDAAEEGKSAEAGGSSREHEEPTAEQRDQRYLRHAARDEATRRQRLEISWDLIGGNVDRVMLIMSGMVEVEPSASATEEQRQLYSAGMTGGLAAFQARDFPTAHGIFEDLARKVPGAERAMVLAAASLDRSGDPMSGIDTLLSFQSGEDHGWDSPFEYARDLVPMVFAAMAAADPATATALGERLRTVMPDESEVPDQRPGRSWWWSEEDDDDRWPPRSRPAAEKVGDADAWRLYWRDASSAFRVANGRFEWRPVRD